MRDTIYREDAIAEICKARTPDIVSHQYAELFINAVRRAPSADRPPQGEWIYCEDYVGHDGYECSNCGFFIPWAYDRYADSNFILNYHTCPHCDARMKGADDEVR